MIRLKKREGENRGFQSFLVSGFSMRFISMANANCAATLAYAPYEGRITTFTFSKCSIICLLTFDLSLAIEWLFFPLLEQNPTFWVSSPLSPLLSLRYLSQEKTSKQIPCQRQRVGLSGSFYQSVIDSLLCPNIKTWLLGPGYYYRIIIHRM